MIDLEVDLNVDENGNTGKNEFEQNVHQNEDTEDNKTQQNLQFDKWTIDEKEEVNVVKDFIQELCVCHNIHVTRNT